MTTVGHPPRLLHGHAATNEVRWVNKADGTPDSPPIASGLPHWVLPAASATAVVRGLFQRGCMSTLDLFAVETFDPSGGKGSDLGAVEKQAIALGKARERRI